MATDFIMREPGDPLEALLNACPFLRDRLDAEDGPYARMGAVGRMIQSRELSDDQIQQVFDAFSDIAEQPDVDLDLLATGAMELLNDDPATARLARQCLRGRALELVEEMRVGWGQPDYS